MNNHYIHKMIIETFREHFFSISIFGRKHVCRLAYSINNLQLNLENWELRRFHR